MKSLQANIFEIFWHFSMYLNFPFKRNEAWLVVIKIVYTSCLTSSQMTQDLRSQKIRIHQKKFQAFIKSYSSAQTSSQNENFVNTSKNLHNSRH